MNSSISPDRVVNSTYPIGHRTVRDTLDEDICDYLSKLFGEHKVGNRVSAYATLGQFHHPIGMNSVRMS